MAHFIGSETVSARFSTLNLNRISGNRRGTIQIADSYSLLLFICMSRVADVLCFWCAQYLVHGVWCMCTITSRHIDACMFFVSVFNFHTYVIIFCDILSDLPECHVMSCMPPSPPPKPICFSKSNLFFVRNSYIPCCLSIAISWAHVLLFACAR